MTQKLRDFSEFPIIRTDLEAMVDKANTPMMLTTTIRGNKNVPALKGQTDAAASTTVDIGQAAKDEALRKLAEFISSYHGNNQRTEFTKGAI